MLRCSLLLTLVVGLVQATVGPSPTWAVYVPAAANDNAGVLDPALKCHTYTRLGNDGVTYTSYYTYLVLHNGAPVTANDDPAIWNAGTPASAVLYETPRTDNPDERLVTLGGNALTAGDNYTAVRMVYIEANGAATIGSPVIEPGRHANEAQASVALGSYWMAADECSQGLWCDVMGLSDADHEAALTAALGADGYTEHSRFLGFEMPTVFCNVADARAFCASLQGLTGTSVALPNEAEWEMACRATTTTPFNTERGYSLAGPQWQMATNDPTPRILEPDEWNDYFEKVEAPRVNGRNNNNWPDPETLSTKPQFIGGSWIDTINSVRFTGEGQIRGKTAFKAVAEVEANFDSRYRYWYNPAYAFAWRTYDGRDAWFSIDENSITADGGGSMALGPYRNPNNDDGVPVGMWASDEEHLARLVTGLWVPVDSNGQYTCDEQSWTGFRQCVGGILPPGVTVAGSQAADPVMRYFQKARFDGMGLFINGFLPKPEDYFQRADEDIADAIARLPLDRFWNNNPRIDTALRDDLNDRYQEAVEKAKALNKYAYVNWGLTRFDVTIGIDTSNLADKLGRYAVRNRWGIANTHGNVYEICEPGIGAGLWDGTGSYDDSSAYGSAPRHRFVAIRGGSFRSSAEKCRSAARVPLRTDAKRVDIGFRFVIR